METTTTKKKSEKREILRGIPDGGMLTLPWEVEKNPGEPNAWCQRAFQLNKEDGYQHYQVTLNRMTRTITLISNPR